MKTITHYLISRRLVILLTVFFFFIRLPFLDSTFLLYDERDTLLTQHALARSGHDLYGNRLPASFDGISPQAPALAMYYGVPFFAAGYPLTVAWGRFLYLLPFSIVPLLVFEILFAITKRKGLAAATAAIFSFSPWVYHISRLALEINIAFPLFLVAVLSQIKRKHSVSFIFYGLSFFTYQGIRPLIPAAFLYFELFRASEKSGKMKPAVMSAVFLVFFFFMLFVASRTEGNLKTRGASEIVFFATERISKEVDAERTPSLFVSGIFSNKLSVMSGYITANLMQGLDASYLFRTGDQIPIYSNSVTGQFYPVLIVFLIGGIMELGRLRRREWFEAAGIALLGIIPSLINIYSTTFSIRSLFSGIGLGFLMAAGISGMRSFLQNKNAVLKYGAYGLVMFLACYQAAGFFYRYATVRGKNQSELFNEKERKLARYLISSKEPRRVILEQPFPYYLSYAFMAQNSDYREIARELNTSTGSLKLNGNVFASCVRKSVSLEPYPRKTVLDEACLTDQAKQTLDIFPGPYQTIPYSDIDLLRSGSNVKFYIFE
jgi:hypothetical protein